MITIKRPALTIAILFLFYITGFNQIPSLRFKYFSRTESLHNSYIYQVIQDSAGFIWIASRDGLYKYDGYSFAGYFAKEGDTTSIIDNSINHLYIDTKGRLWVATALGICYYNAEQDNFVRIADARKEAGLSTLNINQIAEDRNGVLMASNSQTIFRYLEKERKFIPFISLESGQINHFIVDQTNTIWMGCSKGLGLIRYNINTGKRERVKVTGDDQDALANFTISRLALDKNRLWIASLGEGIKLFDIGAGKLIQYPFVNQDEAMAVNIHIDNGDNVWTVDYTGLKILDKQSGTFNGYYPDPNDPFSIRGNVKGIFQDRQGNYWVYHDPGGIGISMLQKGFHHFDNDTRQFWHTSRANIISIQEDSKGSLWLGQHEGGITVFDWRKGTTRNYTYDEKNNYSLGRGSVLCIFRDSQGTMWIGTYFDGLQYFNEAENRFITFRNDPNDPNTISGQDVRSIAEDSEGNLWIAVHAKGIDKYDRKQNKFFHFNHTNNKLSNDWPFQVLIDHNDDLWVATAWGLNHLKKGEDTFKSYVSDVDDSTSLNNNLINAIHEDGNHVLWVGTSSGLNRFNAGRNNFTRFRYGFENRYISGILSDEDGKLWISSLTGLAMVDQKINLVRNFSSLDGLGSDEFNARSLFKNQNNELFFGSTQGLDIFNPHELIYNSTPPYVFIDKIKILNKEITPANSDVLEKHISSTKKITLRYTDKVITLQFKALNFVNPQTNQYAYKLEGFEKNWNYVGTVREATYTNLNPGKYTFRAIAANNDGVWNTRGAKLEIVILPPWYRTLVFKLFAFLIIIGMIAGYIQFRTKEFEKQKVILEKAVKEKTAELSEKNELLKLHTNNLDEANRLLVEGKYQLEQHSEELRSQSKSLADANIELQKVNSTKDKLFSIIAHDLKGPFNTILGFSDMLLDQFDTMGDNEKRSYVKTINVSSERVHTLLHNLLLWARSQTKQISYYPEEMKLRPLIDETVDLVIENIRFKDIQIRVSCDDQMVVWADKEMVKTIFRNLLSNAVKFTPPKGRIEISAISDEHNINISVTDTGLGIKQEKIRALLSGSMITPEPGTQGEKGSGLGLTLCKDFISMNKGRLQITSENGHGSTFAFSLPKTNE